MQTDLIRLQGEKSNFQQAFEEAREQLRLLGNTDKLDRFDRARERSLALQKAAVDEAAARMTEEAAAVQRRGKRVEARARLTEQTRKLTAQNTKLREELACVQRRSDYFEERADGLEYRDEDLAIEEPAGAPVEDQVGAPTKFAPCPRVALQLCTGKVVRIRTGLGESRIWPFLPHPIDSNRAVHDAGWCERE
jgi:hypothetical protein